MMRGFTGASAVAPGAAVVPGPDEFLDTIPEDQSVAQQRVANLSNVSAVASSDSEDEENPQRLSPRRKRKQREGSVTSSNANAIIEAGMDEQRPKQSSEKSRLASAVSCTKRCVVVCFSLLLLVVAVVVGVYFVVRHANEEKESASPVSKDMTEAPTPELTFPPNFYSELSTDPPTLAPSLDPEAIAAIDDALLKVTDSNDYYNSSTPQGACRNWLTHTDRMELRVSLHGEEAVQQRYIICVLYHATTKGDAQWMDSAMPFLNETLHECDWKGVSCNSSRVAVLYLTQRHLNGTIPAELTHLSELQLLSFGENNLTGTIPQGLLELPRLILIDLSSNLLTGTIPSVSTSPETLSRYSPLEVMYLDDNMLHGSVPFFDTLERLRVQRNLFTGFDPGYATLQSLTSWKMYDNIFSGTLPQFWDTPKLFYIDFALNFWTGSIPESLWNLPSLESLALNDAALTGTLPESTVSDHWKYLWLHSNKLAGTIPSTFGSDWVNMTGLRLNNNSLTGSISMEQCSEWPKMERLEMDCGRPNVTCDCCDVCHE